MNDIGEAERQAAIRVVEAACGRGEMMPADRDVRILQLQAARTRTDLDVVLGHLRGELDAAVTPTGPAMSPPLPTVSVSSPELGTGRPSGSKAVVGLVTVLVAVVAAVGVMVFAVTLLSGVSSDSTSSSGVGQGADPAGQPAPDGQPADPAAGPPSVLSRAGFADLLAAVRSETGGTRVFDATLYPEYAVLQLPVDSESRRQQYYRWDGVDLEPAGSFGQASDPRIDLRDVDVKRMLRLSQQIRKQVEEPDSWYVILRSPDAFGGSMYAYANNKFREGGYIAATLDGTAIRTVTY